MEDNKADHSTEEVQEKIKIMDIKEFVELGFLQEANRQFFHPLGLALSVNIDWPEEVSDEELLKYENDPRRHPDSIWSLDTIWDYREDKEGMLFGKDILDGKKFERVNALRESKSYERSQLPECDRDGIQIIEGYDVLVDLKVFEPIFKDFPELKKLPFYSWGRYHIYELRGEPFENYLEGPKFSYFYDRLKDKKGFDRKILAEIDKVCEESYEEVMDGDYLPSREECVKEFGFDAPGGMMLVVERDGDKLKLGHYRCESPE